MRVSLTAAVVAASLTLCASASSLGQSAVSTQLSAPENAASADSLESAGTYFDHARKLGFPAAGQTTPYVLQANFTTRTSSGKVETGTYTDTWLSDTKWRREAILGQSQFVRSRDGKKWYRLDEGSDAALLQFVLTAMEPIPETTGSLRAWKTQRDTVDGEATVQVWSGKMNRDGTPNRNDFEAYWFDLAGQLVKSARNGLVIKRDKFEDFNGVHVARQVQVILDGKVGMKIEVTELQPAVAVDSKMFTIKKHAWLRQYTSEIR